MVRFSLWLSMLLPCPCDVTSPPWSSPAVALPANGGRKGIVVKRANLSQIAQRYGVSPPG